MDDPEIAEVEKALDEQYASIQSQKRRHNFYVVGKHNFRGISWEMVYMVTAFEAGTRTSHSILSCGNRHRVIENLRGHWQECEPALSPQEAEDRFALDFDQILRGYTGYMKNRPFMPVWISLLWPTKPERGDSIRWLTHTDQIRELRRECKWEWEFEEVYYPERLYEVLLAEDPKKIPELRVHDIEPQDRTLIELTEIVDTAIDLEGSDELRRNLSVSHLDHFRRFADRLQKEERLLARDVEYLSESSHPWEWSDDWPERPSNALDQFLITFPRSLAREFTRRRSIGKCAYCCSYFPLRRRDQKYCSKTCKNAAAYSRYYKKNPQKERERVKRYRKEDNEFMARLKSKNKPHER
jgi:hypothetical protein